MERAILYLLHIGWVNMKATRLTVLKHPNLKIYQIQGDSSHLETQHLAAADVQNLETQHLAAADVQNLETQHLAAVDGFKLQETPPENMAAFMAQSGEKGTNLFFPRNVVWTNTSSEPLIFSDVAAHSFSTSIPSTQVSWQQVRSDQQKSTENTSKATKKKKLNFALRIGCTLLLFTFLLKSVSWPTLLNELMHIQHTLLLIGFFLGVFSVFVSSYQWRILLHGEKIHSDLADLVNLYLVGTAFSHFLPTGMGGDAVKAYYVGNESGNIESSASAVIMSRITGYFGMILIAAIVLIIEFHHFNNTVIASFLLLSLLVLGMIAGAIFSVTLLSKFFHKKLAKQRILTKVIGIGNALNKSVKQPRFMSLAILTGVVFWVVACLNYYAYGDSIGIHIPMYFYFVAIPLISLVTFLPISINGFGVRESMLVYVFSTVHIASSTSLLLALLMDAQVLVLGLVGACLYLSMDSKKKAAKGRMQNGK